MTSLIFEGGKAQQAILSRKPGNHGFWGENDVFMMLVGCFNAIMQGDGAERLALAALVFIVLRCSRSRYCVRSCGIGGVAVADTVCIEDCEEAFQTNLTNSTSGC